MTSPSTTVPSLSRSRRSAGLTDVGRKRRSNEDSYLVDDALGLYVVCDGMGGHAAGEVASQEAVDIVYGALKRGVRTLPSLAEPRSSDADRAIFRLMESAVQAATYMVYSMAELDRSRAGMGTTLSAMLLVDEHALLGHVGDSRIYRVRGGEVEQLTEDHTLVGWQLKQGLITRDEAARSPQRNVITRAIGNKDYVQVDTDLVRVSPGDRFLLCSDGLHAYVEADEIAEIVALGAEQAVARLIDVANDRGGKDNITAVVVELD